MAKSVLVDEVKRRIHVKEYRSRKHVHAVPDVALDNPDPYQFADELPGYYSSVQPMMTGLSQAIIDSMTAEIAILDRQGIIVAVNKAWRRYSQDDAINYKDPLLNSEIGSNYLTTCKGLACIEKGYARTIYEGIKQVTDQVVEDFSFDYACDTMSNQRWFNISAAQFEANHDYLIINHLDITSQIRASNMLEKLSIAVDHSPAAIVIVDKDTKIQFVNSKFTEVTGYNVDDVIGKNPRMFQSGRTPLTVHLDLWEKIGHGKPWQGELINRRKNGEIFTDEMNVTPVVNPDGVVTNYVAVHVDITERKAIEENLKRSRAQLNAFVRHAPVSIAMFDRQLNYIAYSDHWFTEFGQGYGSLIGLNHYQVLSDIPDDWRIIHQQCLAGETVKNDAYLWQRADRSVHWLRWVVQPWTEENERTGGILVMIEDITESILAQSDLRAVLAESVDAIWIADDAGKVAFANPAALKLTGHTFDELQQQSFFETIAEKSREELAVYLEQLENKKFIRHEWELKGRNGSMIWLELTIGKLTDGRYLAFGRDLTETKRTDAELRKLFQAVEQNPESILICNVSGNIEYVNQAFLTKTGYERAEVIGKNPRILHSGKTPPDYYRAMWQSLLNGDKWQGELYNRTKDGTEFIDFATISPIHQADGRISHFVSIQANITDNKLGEARIHDLAFFDQLTGLPNKILMEDRLNQILTINSRTGEHGALLFIDLDHFKNVNDTLGHHMGDQMLKMAAKCLLNCVQACDAVARFGGDEFIVLLSGLDADETTAAKSAAAAAYRILDALDQIYQLGDAQMHSTASIGVTLFQGADTNAAELLKQADMAMYQSKEGGRNSVRFFDPSLELEMKQRTNMEEDLRQAIDKEQFSLYYQPQFNHQRELIGAEVLIRWIHPIRGVISPAVFIPFAEENGSILAIGEWVLRTACLQLTKWEQQADFPAVSLAVNVSAFQFKQPNFVDSVCQTLVHTGANARHLKLELTESMLIENLEEIIEKMVILKKLGISFSLDDFGTGYSSLSFLKRLPLTQLKIDQSFVKHVLSDANDATIARTIVTLAHSLGLSVIAEGVETEEQKDFLFNAGCHDYQGYLYSRPLPLAEFEQLLKKECHQPECRADLHPEG